MKYRVIIFQMLLMFCCLSAAVAEEKFIEIKAKKFQYTPHIIEVNKGDTVQIRLISEDVHHGLYLDGYEIKTSAYPGQDGHLKFTADKPGKFVFRCSTTCGEFHPYMVGELYVRPNRLFKTSAIIALLLAGLALLLALGKKWNGTAGFKLFGLVPMNLRFELTQFKIVRTFFKSRWFPFIALIVNLFIFVIILLAGFIGGWASGNYNFGVMIVWILWWVALMIFMVPIVGRLWCMVCPFPLIGDWIQRGKLVEVGRQKSWGFAKKWPAKLKNLWPLVILFWFSTWFSGFFTVRPFATFILLGSIILTAIIVAMIFEKRTFCITMCPVSGFMGLYSNFSLCAVRSKDAETCRNHKLKTCQVGNENGYGCPWMELPNEMNRNTYCGLCLECFKTCPYDNMGFFVRPFGQDLFAERRKTDDIYKRRDTDEAFKGLTMLGVFLSFFLAFQGPVAGLKDMVRAKTTGGYLSYIGESFLVDFLLIPGLYLIFALLAKIMSGAKEVSLRKIFVNFSYCLVPIGLAIWAAFSIGIILPNGSYLLHIISDPFAWGWNLFGTAHFPWTPVFTDIMPYLQAGLTLIGFLFALDFGPKLARQTFPTPAAAKRAWLSILAYLTLITVIFLGLFLVSADFGAMLTRLVQGAGNIIGV